MGKEDSNTSGLDSLVPVNRSDNLLLTEWTSLHFALLALSPDLFRF